MSNRASTNCVALLAAATIASAALWIEPAAARGPDNIADVAEAVAIPEELRGKIPGDYGRNKGIAWYYLGGFGIVHNSTSAVGNVRIVKWDSGA